MFVLEDLLYTEDHLWLRVLSSDEVLVGLTDYVQERLGEITSVELPAEGEEVSKDEEFIFIDTLAEGKDFYAPVSGVVEESNPRVLNDPSLINKDPYEDGWLVRLKMAHKKELDDLMGPDEYGSYVEELRLRDEEELEDDMMEEMEE